MEAGKLADEKRNKKRNNEKKSETYQGIEIKI